MNKSFTLEEKINTILGDDFILNDTVNYFYTTNKRGLSYIHKSQKGKIVIVFQEKTNEEQGRITALYSYKQTEFSYYMKEDYEFDLQEEQEAGLNKLISMKTKMCIAGIF
jgi:hypothetical protein